MLANGEANTLHADDRIDGGQGTNLLKVEMHKAFTGFDGVKQEDGTVLPNVVNVENVELTNATNNRSMTFNAKNMEGVKHWTLNDNDANAISLSNLDAAGITVDIQNLKQGTTNLGFAADAVKGTDDALTVGLDNVGSSKAMVLNANGIENLTLKGSTDSTSGKVDLSNLDDLDNLIITGKGTVDVTAVDKGLKSLDASGAEGWVSANLSAASKIASIKGGSGNDSYTINPQLHNNTTIDGGEGFDTVAITSGTFNGSTAWTSVENLQLGGGASPMTANLSSQNVPDLTTVTLVGGATVNTVLNLLQQSEMTVKDNNGNGNVTLRGDASNGQNMLQNVVYDAIAPTNGKAKTFNTKLDTDAGENITVNIQSATNSRGTELVTYKGAVTAKDAQGELLVKADGNLEAADFTAGSVASANIDANGALTDTIFRLGKASDIVLDAAKGTSGTGIVLVNKAGANSTTQITSHGDFTIANDLRDAGGNILGTSDLTGITDLTINQYGGQFDAWMDVQHPANGLVNAANVTINGFSGTDATNVRLGSIGSAKQAENVTVTVNNVEDFKLNDITTNNADIDVNVINGNGNVTMAWVSAAKGAAGPTSAQIDNAGDVSLTFDAIGKVHVDGVVGNNISFNASQVTGTNGGEVGGGSAGAYTWLYGNEIQYTGCDGKDSVIASIYGQGSVINGGYGNDVYSVQLGNTTVADSYDVTVDMAQGNDSLTVNGSPSGAKGTLTVNVEGFSIGSDSLVIGTALKSFANGVDGALAALVAWDVASEGEVDAVQVNASKTIAFYGGNAYMFTELTQADGGEMIVLEGIVDAGLECAGLQ